MSDHLGVKSIRQFVAVWGFGGTWSEVGVLSSHDTREDAERAAEEWVATQDNHAIGAWVREADQD